MKQTINWRKFKDKMPKEDGWYLVAMEDHIPMVGYIKKKEYSCPYVFEYECMGRKTGIHFDQKLRGRMIAWVPAKELYEEK